MDFDHAVLLVIVQTFSAVRELRAIRLVGNKCANSPANTSVSIGTSLFCEEPLPIHFPQLRLWRANFQPDSSRTRYATSLSSLKQENNLFNSAPSSSKDTLDHFSSGPVADATSNLELYRDPNVRSAETDFPSDHPSDRGPCPQPVPHPLPARWEAQLELESRPLIPARYWFWTALELDTESGVLCLLGRFNKQDAAMKLLIMHDYQRTLFGLDVLPRTKGSREDTLSTTSSAPLPFPVTETRHPEGAVHNHPFAVARTAASSVVPQATSVLPLQPGEGVPLTPSLSTPESLSKKTQDEQAPKDWEGQSRTGHVTPIWPPTAPQPLTPSLWPEDWLPPPGDSWPPSPHAAHNSCQLRTPCAPAASLANPDTAPSADFTTATSSRSSGKSFALSLYASDDERGAVGPGIPPVPSSGTLRAEDSTTRPSLLSVCPGGVLWLGHGGPVLLSLLRPEEVEDATVLDASTKPACQTRQSSYFERGLSLGSGGEHVGRGQALHRPPVRVVSLFGPPEQHPSTAVVQSNEKSPPPGIFQQRQESEGQVGSSSKQPLRRAERALLSASQAQAKRESHFWQSLFREPHAAQLTRTGIYALFSRSEGRRTSSPDAAATSLSPRQQGGPPSVLHIWELGLSAWSAVRPEDVLGVLAQRGHLETNH